MHQGIILLAHGSRDPLWKRPIEAVATQVREQAPNILVSCAYIELTEPDLLQCATNLITQGANSIRVFPMFLGIGKHARDDIPLQMEQVKKLHPDIIFELLPTAGECEELTALLAQLALR